MKVSLPELAQATSVIIKYLEESGRSEFQIDDDYYWNVPESTRYDNPEQPRELTVGQLSDDWGEIQAMISGERPAVGRSMVWLAAILRRIGEKTP